MPRVRIRAMLILPGGMILAQAATYHPADA